MDLARDLIMAVKRNNSHGGYGLQKECEALVSHVLSNMVKTKMPQLIIDEKNDDASNCFRDEGNQCFVSGDDDEAIEKYTMSLAYAVSDESASLALANRSAALFRKQLYRECLIDVEAALARGYPEKKQVKLRERAERAVNSLRQLYQLKDLNMNDLPGAKEARSSGTKHEGQFSLVGQFVEEGRNQDDIGELLSEKPKNSPRYVIDEEEMGFAYGPSNEAPALSKGVRITYSDKYGRHLIAERSFKPGDIIAMEDPFAYVIYREMYYTHCHFCLERTHNLIPCPKCPLSLYCSEKCKNLSWEYVHRLECPVQAVLSKLLNVDKDKIRILTKIIRLLLVATKNGTCIEELRKDSQIAELNPDNRTAGFTESEKFDSDSARSALSLATNLGTRPPIEISAFACISALAVILLATETNFFGEKYDSDHLKNIIHRSDIKFCGSLVFRNCVIVSSNSFSIQQEAGIKSGSGLYIAASLLNHSCAPNTFRHFNGLTMITRALQPIKEGDQIFTCYGGGYQYMIRSERKSKMKAEYFFDCDCQACVEDWPTYSEILRLHIGSITKTKKALVAKLKPFRQRLIANKYDINAVKNILDILYAEMKMPCEEIVHAVQYLKSYYLDP